MTGAARVAVYYAPAVDDPLWVAGCAWLGRDAARGVVVGQPEVAGLGAATATARGYGFHATLKAPFRPVAGLAEVVARLESMAAEMVPVVLPRLLVGRLGRFLALVAEERSAGLGRLADAVVAGLDDLRAPLTEAELVRRRGAGLSAAGEAMLARWGYPEVFGEWRFHMTLAGPLGVGEQDRLAGAAAAHFAAALAMPRVVGDVCLFVQPAAGRAFGLVARVKLGRF